MDVVRCGCAGLGRTFSVERIAAPANDTSFIMRARGASTPGVATPVGTPGVLVGAQTPASVEHLAAGRLQVEEPLDCFGSMQGRIVPAAAFNAGAAHSGAEESSSSDEEHLAETRGLLLVQDDDKDWDASDGTDLRHRLEQQAKYICTLEDDNLNLRERLQRLEHELARFQQGGAMEVSEMGDCNSALCSAPQPQPQAQPQVQAQPQPQQLHTQQHQVQVQLPVQPPKLEAEAVHPEQIDQHLLE